MFVFKGRTLKKKSLMFEEQKSLIFVVLLSATGGNGDRQFWWSTVETAKKISVDSGHVERLKI